MYWLWFFFFFLFFNLEALTPKSSVVESTVGMVISPSRMKLVFTVFETEANVHLQQLFKDARSIRTHFQLARIPVAQHRPWWRD